MNPKVLLILSSTSMIYMKLIVDDIALVQSLEADLVVHILNQLGGDFNPIISSVVQYVTFEKTQSHYQSQVTFFKIMTSCLKKLMMCNKHCWLPPMLRNVVLLILKLENLSVIIMTKEGYQILTSLVKILMVITIINLGITVMEIGLVLFAYFATI